MIVVGTLVFFFAVAFTPASTEDSEANIFNGDVVDKFEWPWVAWISYNLPGDSDNENRRCTGSLIDPLWVLTTAQCFVGYDNFYIGYFWGSRPLYIGLGDYDITAGGDREQIIEAEKVILKNGFGRYGNDIALIKLKEPAKTWKKTIDVVPGLSTSNILEKVMDREYIKCYSVGWGMERTLEGGWRYPSLLQELPVKVVSNRTYCDRYFWGWNGDDQICTTGDTNGRSARCYYGDKGAPLMCWVNNQWTQIGMFSTQHVYDGCMGGVGLDTDISKFRRWISRTMRQNRH